MLSKLIKFRSIIHHCLYLKQNGVICQALWCAPLLPLYTSLAVTQPVWKENIGLIPHNWKKKKQTNKQTKNKTNKKRKQKQKHHDRPNHSGVVTFR